jgi:hypothetical protein
MTASDIYIVQAAGLAPSERSAARENGRSKRREPGTPEGIDLTVLEITARHLKSALGDRRPVIVTSPHDRSKIEEYAASGPPVGEILGVRWRFAQHFIDNRDMDNAKAFLKAEAPNGGVVVVVASESFAGSWLYWAFPASNFAEKESLWRRGIEPTDILHFRISGGRCEFVEVLRDQVASQATDVSVTTPAHHLPVRVSRSRRFGRLFRGWFSPTWEIYALLPGATGSRGRMTRNTANHVALRAERLRSHLGGTVPEMVAAGVGNIGRRTGQDNTCIRSAEVVAEALGAKVGNLSSKRLDPRSPEFNDYLTKRAPRGGVFILVLGSSAFRGLVRSTGSKTTLARLLNKKIGNTDVVHLRLRRWPWLWSPKLKLVEVLRED